jgi:epoxyqueuosine reductase
MSNSTELSNNIKLWGQQIGLSLIGITSADAITAPTQMQAWLAKGYHGEMNYLTSNLTKRFNPTELMPEAKSIICCAINYYQPNSSPHISRYALGRDYHKVMRKYLKKFAKKISQEIGEFKFRYFVDSAPVAEKDLAIKAGLGWRGKNSLLINPDFGSWLFLGEIYTNLELTPDKPQLNQCGACNACIKACPSKAILAPYQIDASRCLAYLTIEHKSQIPEEYRSLIGDCIYGCDICQNVCPWNKNAKTTNELDFFPRKNLADASLAELASWDEAEFLKNTEGTAIRRIGFQRWRRNIKLAISQSAFSSPLKMDHKK